MTLRRWSIQAQFVALLLVTLLPLGGVIGYTILGDAREERARVEHELHEMATLLSVQVGQRVVAVYERVDLLARLPAIREGGRETAEGMLRVLFSQEPDIENLALIAPDGTVLASAVQVPTGKLVSLKDSEWLQRVVRWNQPAAGGFEISPILGTPVAVLAYPVLNDAGQVSRVITAAVSLWGVNLAVPLSHPSVVPVWAVVDERGLVLFHSDPAFPRGRALEPIPGMLRGQVAVPGTGWRAVVDIPKTAATTRVRQAFFHLGLPAALLLLLAAALSLWIARNIWRPLQTLTVAVRQVGLGSSALQMSVQTGGEIGELTRAFGETLAALDRRRLELASLLEASRAIDSSLDLEQSLHAIVQQAANISGAPAIRLFLLDEDTQVLRYRVGIGLPPEEERNRVVPVGESFSGQVAATGKPLAVADTRGDSRLIYPEHVLRFGLVSYLGLPVKVGNRVIGVLVINTTAPRTYSEEEIAFLTAFADQAAIAIENARLHAAAVRRGAELEALLQGSRLVMSGLDLQTIFKRIVTEAAQISGCPHVKLLLVDKDAGLLHMGAHTGTTVPDGFPMPLGTGLSGSVAQTGQPLFVPNTHTDPRSVLGTQDKQLGMLTYLGLPIKIRDEVLGVLTFNTEAPHEYTPEEIAYLTSFADQAAIAIENARLHAATVRRGAELEALLRAARSVMAGLDLHESLDRIVEEASRIAGTPHVKVLLRDPETQLLRVGAVAGHPGAMFGHRQYPPTASLSGIVAATGQPLFTPDSQNDPRNPHGGMDRELGLVTYLGLPIKSRGEVVGVLTFNTESPHEYTPEEIAYLTSFADQAAIAIENARLHETTVRRAQQLATLNELTRKLTTVLEPQRVAEEILAAAQALIPGAAGRLWKRVEETDRFRVVASLGLREPEGGRHEFRAGEGLVGRATATRQPVISPDIASDTQLVNRAWLVAEGRASAVVLPLLYGERVTGALGIFTSTPHTFSDEELDLLRSFAAQAAIAIENARLHEAAVRRAGELQALLRATRTVMSGLDLKGTLDRIIQEAAQISKIPHVKLVLVDKEAAVVRVAAAVGRPAEMLEGFAVPLGTGTSGYVAATGEPLFIAECQTDPRNAKFAGQDRALGIVTYLGLPIKVRDEVLGVLTFNTTEPHEYTPEEIAYLTSFADQAAVAIENARLFAAADHRATELETLRKLGQAIAGRLDLSGVLEAVVSGAMRILGNPFAQIILWDEATQRLSFGAALGADSERIRNQTFEVGRGINGTVARTRQPMIVEDYQASPYAVPECSDVVATITVPILFGGRLLGVLHSHTTEPGRRFSRDDLHLFQMLAAQAAVAIENARLYGEALEKSERLEGLTRTSAKVAGTLRLEEVLDAIVEEAAKLLRTEGAGFRLVEGDRLVVGSMCGVARHVMLTPSLRIGESLSGSIAEQGRPIMVEDLRQEAQHLPVHQRAAAIHSVAAFLGVPVRYRDKTIGVLNVYGKEPRRFSEAEVALLSVFADQAAVVIENARLYDTIRRHAADLEARVRARTAELEEALRVKVEFLAKMSHELRTPLNFVIGFSELLQQEVGGPLTPKQATYVDRIHNGGKRLLQLIGDILDITQVDAGKSGLHLEPVIVSSLVQEVLGAVQVQVAQKRLDVTTALDPWLPFIVADRFKLAQVLRNLVENAVKFTPDGGAIKIVTRQGAGSQKVDGEGQATPPEEFAEVIVEDTGIGIRPENLEPIFGPFYQVDGSEIRAYGGAGLGLALVRKLVELHGGRVWAESEGPDRGARFIVRLPRLEAPRAKRILLVEDEHLLRVPMAAALENAGFSVVQAATKAEALTAMEATVPDLLVLDILLPDGDGWEILRHVREAEEVRTLPVLVITALETVHAEQALARGADEFLTKPVSPRVLVDTVARLLGQLGGEPALLGQGGGVRGAAPDSAARTPERGQGWSSDAAGGNS